MAFPPACLLGMLRMGRHDSFHTMELHGGSQYFLLYRERINRFVAIFYDTNEDA